MKPDFTQPSTWRGILGLLAVMGFGLHPESLESIALFLGAGCSIIEIIRNERLF